MGIRFVEAFLLVSLLVTSSRAFSPLVRLFPFQYRPCSRLVPPPSSLHSLPLSITPLSHESTFEKAWKNIPTDLYSHLSFFSPILILRKFVQSVPNALKIFQQLHWIYILDLLLICGSLAVYRPLFYQFFKWTHKPTDNYRKSLFGHLERPLSYTMYYGPFLYLIDFLSILFHNLGFEFHLKVLISPVL